MNKYGPSSGNKILRWDKYYGNFVYIGAMSEKVNDKTDTELYEIQVPVRVIHNVQREAIPTDQINFEEHIPKRILNYYIKYFPWLHTKLSPDTSRYEKLGQGYFDRGIKKSIEDNIHKILDRLKFK